MKADDFFLDDDSKPRPIPPITLLDTLDSERCDDRRIRLARIGTAVADAVQRGCVAVLWGIGCVVVISCILAVILFAGVLVWGLL